MLATYATPEMSGALLGERMHAASTILSVRLALASRLTYNVPTIDCLIKTCKPGVSARKVGKPAKLGNGKPPVSSAQPGTTVQCVRLSVPSSLALSGDAYTRAAGSEIAAEELS